MADQKTKKNSIVRRISYWLHLWLGLLSGIVVFLVCLSGTIFVFHDEINNYVNRNVIEVSIPKIPVRLSPDLILNNFKHNYPKSRILYVTEYKKPNYATKMVIFSENSKSKFTNMGCAYVNPYTGEILTVDYTYGLFRMLAGFHMNLLLGKIGSHIVQISTVIFLIELITGLIWWWPKKWNKSIKDKSFKIKWKAKWKRLNIDLHNVLGFYALPLAIVLTFTGVILSYRAVQNFVFGTIGGNSSAKSIYQSLPQADSLKTSLRLEELLQTFKIEMAAYNQLTYAVPNPKSSAIFVKLENESSMVTYRGKQVFVDIYTGKQLTNLSSAAIKQADIMNSNIALHIGTWYGLPSKIITFIVCLICTSLPITGFIIWYNRKFKKKKNIVSKN